MLAYLWILIQFVGGAWAMTQMTSSADKVALVTTALMVPMVLLSMPAAPLPTCMTAVSFASCARDCSLRCHRVHRTPLVRSNHTKSCCTCFVVGSGMALMNLAWRSSISEQVPAEALPAAVALDGISYNIARSFGLAIGDIVVATAGAVAAFALNALLYLPLILALFLWKRVLEPSPLPREQLIRAIVSGVRCITNSRSLKIVLTRTIVTGVIGDSISALMPLVTRDLLPGGAQTYGVVLGALVLVLLSGHSVSVRCARV
ncbi:MFS transporter [Bradyrhizobium sp. 150]|uniref:MFS transporter n=1 Tax=Bradyrhizobium sp. 150 TaxID=2782625 RepID=UPI001FFB0A53|nr:MFS transporter [Bradyrhizobium sp. 150]